MSSTSVDIIATPPVDAGPTRAAKDSGPSPFDNHLQRASQPQGTEAKFNSASGDRAASGNSADRRGTPSNNQNTAQTNATGPAANQADASADVSNDDVGVENAIGTADDGPVQASEKTSGKKPVDKKHETTSATLLPTVSVPKINNPTLAANSNSDPAAKAKDGPVDHSRGKKTTAQGDKSNSKPVNSTDATATEPVSQATPTTAETPEVNNTDKAASSSENTAKQTASLTPTGPVAPTITAVTPAVATAAVDQKKSDVGEKKIGSAFNVASAPRLDRESRADGPRQAAHNVGTRATAPTTDATIPPTEGLAANAALSPAADAVSQGLIELNDALPAAEKLTTSGESTAALSPETQASQDATTSATTSDRARSQPTTAPRAETAGSTSTLSEVDRVRFVQRVSRAFQVASDRGGSLRLRLSPPELGSLHMEVNIRDGVMSARIEAQTPAAQSALLSNLPQLRDRLAEQNIRIEKFDVSLSSDLSGQQSEQQSPQEQGSANSSNNKIIVGAAAAESSSPPILRRGGGQLNVIV
jgi:flagellar hook-length control protein FliK